MRKQLLLIALLFLPLCLVAQEQDDSNSAGKEAKRSSSRILTGLSGGMMLHAGYMFSDSPDKIFSNTGLGNPDYVKALPKDGACFGLGGTLRLHLIDHIHLGAEGHVSTMPLMKTGSNVRNAWGGALCDYYFNLGNVRPILGMTVGGGAMRRLYVPDKEAVAVPAGTTDSTYYNASYTRTPFFLMDPYVGMEIGLGSHMAIIVRIDYLLAFGTSKSSLSENVQWSNFMTPGGPRLYVGILFGKLKK
ncbi:MAG: hypothetical protein IJ814_01280 [Paludibacteraceae bacterium]|nr:hypothetical protein [Paludibacteraceae bacterium]